MDEAEGTNEDYSYSHNPFHGKPTIFEEAPFGLETVNYACDNGKYGTGNHKCIVNKHRGVLIIQELKTAY